MWNNECCWVTCLFMFLGWWLLASALLFFTWNKVIAALAPVRSAKFWQAVLVVATLVAFCGPRYVMKYKRYYGGCQISQQAKMKADCPKCHKMRQMGQPKGSTTE